MLLKIFSYFDKLFTLNYFKLIDFRFFIAFFITFVTVLLVGGEVIKFMKKIQYLGHPIRIDGPKKHIIMKNGTPSMGGVFIIFIVLTTTMFLVDKKNLYIWILIVTIVIFGIIGLLDDLKKFLDNTSKGITFKIKFLIELILSILLMIATSILHNNFNTIVTIPFFKNFIIDFGFFYYIFIAVVVIGSSNAVNLTDGLDGLVSMPLITICCFLTLLIYITKNIIFTKYNKIFYFENINEIMIVCMALAGSCLAFLWFNAPQAMIFMGDVGSLSFGSIIGIISIIIKQELMLLIISFIFVIETMSVLIQIISFKVFKRKVFLMSPIHHHFEHLKWKESVIVIRFWILSIIFFILGLISLKN